MSTRQTRKGGTGRRGNRRGEYQKKKTLLFDDLEGKSNHILIEMCSNTKDAMKTAVVQRTNLQKERGQLIEIVKEMRSAFTGISEERNELLRRIKKAQDERKEARKKRDSADERVPPSPDDIEFSLKQRHKPLSTMMNDLKEMPNLRQEISLLESFFEYQAMYEIAKFSNEQHQVMKTAIKEIKAVMLEFKKLDKKTEEEKAKIESKSEDNDTEITGIGWKEVERISARIKEIDDKRKKIKQEIGALTNELQRLEAFMRMEEEAAKAKLINPEEIREKAVSGGTLSLQDLSTLISTGGIESLSKKPNQSGGDSKPLEDRKKTRRRSSARRGKARASTLTPKEERKD